VGWHSKAPLGRPSQPSEVATSFVFLASPEAATYCKCFKNKQSVVACRTCHFKPNYVLIFFFINRWTGFASLSSRRLEMGLYSRHRIIYKRKMIYNSSTNPLNANLLSPCSSPTIATPNPSRKKSGTENQLHPIQSLQLINRRRNYSSSRYRWTLCNPVGVPRWTMHGLQTQTRLARR